MQAKGGGDENELLLTDGLGCGLGDEQTLPRPQHPGEGESLNSKPCVFTAFEANVCFLPPESLSYVDPKLDLTAAELEGVLADVLAG